MTDNTTTPTPRQAYITGMLEQAREGFTNHVLRWSSDTRWLIMQKYKDGGWDGNLAAEISCTYNGQIVVVGDIGPMVFAYNRVAARARVRWMGRNDDLSYYVLQKAAIGMSRNAVEQWDPEVARKELDQILTEASDYGLSEENVVELKTAKAFTDDEHEFWRNIHESDDSGNLSELVSNVGRVPNASVFYCHAALRRLCELWDEEDADKPGSTMAALNGDDRI